MFKRKPLIGTFIRLPAVYMLLLLCLFAVSGSALGQSPVPLINQPLVPEDALPGGPVFTLTINGTGFLHDATVNWNGTALPTTFFSPPQLAATVN